MSSRLHDRRRGVFAALVAMIGACAANAFPPAPNYTIYGFVRDQLGANLVIEGAEIILLRDTVEIGRAPIFKDLRLDSNYELNISLDQSLAGTRTYSTKALAPQGIDETTGLPAVSRTLPDSSYSSQVARTIQSSI